ncbi:hypothetical protein KJ784_03165 [Patescibacteria group bacterium]|nr:hypothetical protein [Patescibacteria group bacterium]MBU2265156.1 hypothetical protein [Patescibacteria group bacterium]
MVPLHDGSGFVEISNLIKWAKTILPDQKKCILKLGTGPFMVLDGGRDWLYLIKPGQKSLKRYEERQGGQTDMTKLQIPSELTSSLFRIYMMIPSALASKWSSGYEPSYARDEIKSNGESIRHSWNAYSIGEKKQAIEGLKEAVELSLEVDDKNSTHRYLRKLIASLQKK